LGSIADEGFGWITTIPEVPREGEKRIARYSDEHETRVIEVVIRFDNLSNGSDRQRDEEAPSVQ
jgi:hypothetical protein